MKLLLKYCLVLLLVQSANASTMRQEKCTVELPLSDFLTYPPECRLDAIIQHCCEESHCEYTPSYQASLWREDFGAFCDELIICLDGFSCYYSGILTEDIVAMTETHLAERGKTLTFFQKQELEDLLEKLIED